jgi:hypothetical protein
LKLLGCSSGQLNGGISGKRTMRNQNLMKLMIGLMMLSMGCSTIGGSKNKAAPRIEYIVIDDDFPLEAAKASALLAAKDDTLRQLVKIARDYQAKARAVRRLLEQCESEQ